MIDCFDGILYIDRCSGDICYALYWKFIEKKSTQYWPKCIHSIEIRLFTNANRSKSESMVTKMWYGFALIRRVFFSFLYSVGWILLSRFFTRFTVQIYIVTFLYIALLVIVVQWHDFDIFIIISSFVDFTLSVIIVAPIFKPFVNGNGKITHKSNSMYLLENILPFFLPSITIHK